MASNRLPVASRKRHENSTINHEIGARAQAACGSTLTFCQEIMMERPHPVLGTITGSENNPYGVEATISFAGRSIPVRIDPDDCTMDDAIEFASTVVADLFKLDPEAKRIVVRDLCPLYNDGWNEFDEMQGDGSFKTVKNPKLTEDEFESKLALDEIGITGAESIDFWYDDSNMFWGHGVLVSALDGLDLSHAEAELFG